MPLVSADVYRELLRHTDAPCIIPKYRGRLGHPILLDGEAIEIVRNRKDSDGLRGVLESIPTLSIPVEDPHTLTDLDTPEDLKRVADPD
jgi:molybdenum cofactor cytidylyltransferase